jgi:hypothetical protein
VKRPAASVQQSATSAKDLEASSLEDASEVALEIDAEDEEAIERALVSVREGRGIPLDEFLTILQRV